MKYTIIILILSIGVCQGQTIDYGYDNSGNRTSRSVIHLLSSTGGSMSSNISNKTAIDEADDQKETTLSSNNNGIVIYPNPVSSELFIENQKSDNQILQKIKVFNSNGQVLYARENVLGDVTVPFHHLPRGSYVLWVLMNNQVWRYEIIKA